MYIHYRDNILLNFVKQERKIELLYEYLQAKCIVYELKAWKNEIFVIMD